MKSQRPFLTNWMPITSILFRILRICRSLFKCNSLKNEKLSLNFLFHLWNLHQILKIFKKKKIVIANLFPKLQCDKDLVKALSEKRRNGTSSDSEHLKVSQKLVKSVLEHFYYVFSSFSGEIFWKIFLLLNFQIIGVFVNTLNVDYKYNVPDFENLPFAI